MLNTALIYNRQAYRKARKYFILNFWGCSEIFQEIFGKWSDKINRHL